MRRLTTTLTALAIAAFVCTANAQTEAEMKKWTDYMTPGDVHKMLASWNGEWTGEVSLWMAPGAPPSTSTSISTNKMILGGRYQLSNHSGSFSGMPFEGMSTVAYDNNKKVFESTWIDNMGTGIMHLQGPWDPATKTITLTGKVMDAMTGKETVMKETLKVVDANTQIMTMYAPGPDGKEFKSMEIKYVRKK